MTLANPVPMKDIKEPFEVPWKYTPSKSRVKKPKPPNKELAIRLLEIIEEWDQDYCGVGSRKLAKMLGVEHRIVIAHLDLIQVVQKKLNDRVLLHHGRGCGYHMDETVEEPRSR